MKHGRASAARPAAGPEPMVVVEEPKREKKPKVTCPEARSQKESRPKLVAAARELRDRWLEHVNAGEMLIEERGEV